MTVISYSEGDLFVFRTIKFLTTNPDNKWANSYEFRATQAGDTGNLMTLATILVLFEVNLEQNVVQHDHTIISTWEADSVPYNPSSFISIPETAAGSVTPSGDIEPLNMCLSVRRVPSSGRFGHIFLRGVLDETFVTAPAGKAVLADPTGFQGRLEDALSGSELEIYIGSAVEAPLEMVMINAAGTQVRPVVNMTVAGISTLPLDHAWFNRTTT